MKRKVTVVGGAGNVGATVARQIAEKELADVVIIDIAESKAAGIGLDIYETCPIIGSDVRVIGGADWAPAAGSDIVVIPVANPLDAMAQALFKLTKFPKQRIIGMAGVLDSARMSTFIAMELGVSVENVSSFVLGGHGDTMVPLPRYSTVAGIPITDLMSKEQIDAIAKRTAGGGLEITKLVGTSAWYAPGQAATEMVEAILRDKKKILPCSVYLEGEYGINGLFVGVPVKLGARGLEQIIQIKLTPEEDAALKKSAASVKELVDVIGM